MGLHPQGSTPAGVPADRLLQPVRFATEALPPAEQFPAWRDFMSPAVDVALDGDSRLAFPAEQQIWDLGSLALTHAVMPQDGRMRRWRHLKRDPLDHWCLVLTGGGHEARAPALFVRSLARPFEGGSIDRDVLSLYIPRDLFLSQAAAIDGLSNRGIDGPLRALLGDYLLSLHHRLPTIPAPDLPKLVEATRMLIAACLLPGAERMEAAHEAVSLSLIDRARRIVQQNLAAPNFGPQQICRMLGVSRSRLYRLFEPLGGVTHYIQRQRMLAAHAALSDPLNNGLVVRIAERVGFTDASVFSRAFRQEFGYSPSYARAVASLSAVVPTMRLPVQRRERASLADVLSRLGA